MNKEEKKAICNALSWLADIENVKDMETLERVKVVGTRIIEEITDPDIREHFKHLAGIKLIKIEVSLKW